ncbi:putative Arsenite-transporting ATPase [Nostocoides australiense Ben110]|uniref:Putative Arsenite-transporting ATPase n=1 Tax=Nostocoides australiense Ben110 TaxID=1193182 RepID=W6JTY7_9MICO|nr:putative Arsenite-transporting ATPase [Tetrasphaera australiensis Ben110]
MSDSRGAQGVRLHIVTGKGGTGKTTVAAALGIALAGQGRKVLLAEVEDRQGISQTFDVPPLSHTETLIFDDPSGGSLWGMAVEPKSALLEYLHKFYKLGRAGSLLEKIGAIDFATTIAPGLRDVLLIGKVYEAVGRREGRGRHGKTPTYDAVVLDAPPTGRVARFLGVNEEVAEVARMGPIKGQADSITAMLKSRITAVHIVTLLEEMPVQECLDAVHDLDPGGQGPRGPLRRGQRPAARRRRRRPRRRRRARPQGHDRRPPGRGGGPPRTPRPPRGTGPADSGAGPGRLLPPGAGGRAGGGRHTGARRRTARARDGVTTWRVPRRKRARRNRARRDRPGRRWTSTRCSPIRASGSSSAAAPAASARRRPRPRSGCGRPSPGAASSS